MLVNSAILLFASGFVNIRQFCCVVVQVFSARQHIAYMLSSLYAIAVCLSHGWISLHRVSKK